jgi:hypothetical protein
MVIYIYIMLILIIDDYRGFCNFPNSTNHKFISTAFYRKYPAMLSVKWCQMAIHLPCQSQSPQTDPTWWFFLRRKQGFCVSTGMGQHLRPTPFLSVAGTITIHHLVFTKYMTWFLDCWAGCFFCLKSLSIWYSYIITSPVHMWKKNIAWFQMYGF